MSKIATPTRQTIFQMAARRLRAEFEELRTIPHLGAKGGEAEGLVRRFLNDHLPKRFSAGAGFIIDHRDQVSKQSDVVVYDAMYCPVYRASDDAAIFPSDNVAAVVEVKSSLDRDRLEEAYKNIQSAKRLAKTKAPDVPGLITTQTLGLVFAFESALTLEKISEHYTNLLRGNSLGDHIDLIAVLDRGLVTMSVKVPQLGGWKPCIFEDATFQIGEGTHIALGSMKLEDDTLDAFLRMLLAHLAHFRGMVDHPGFAWSGMGSECATQLRYLTSITLERDPDRRAAKLKEYEEQVVREFAASSGSASQ